LSESDSAPQGTSVDVKRTHPVSVWNTLRSAGVGTAMVFRAGGTRTVAINNPTTSPATSQRSAIILVASR
jgi:hypothetical protein